MPVSASQPVRTKLSVVLLALRAALKTATGFPDERVLLLARDDLPFRPQADQYITIRPRNQRWDKIRTGSGRFENVVRRRITVSLATRLLLDENSEDTEWMTNATLGHFFMEHMLFDALEMWQPVDANGDFLLREPVALEEASAAERTHLQSGWGQAAYSFDACYVLDLTNPTL